MNAEAQRIAIAEACGWQSFIHPTGVTYYPPNLHLMQNVHGHVMPDYLHDLNAMHEAEKVAIIGTSFEDAYYCSLADDFGTGVGCDWHKGMSATAAQRAEAFLRTIGKWEEQAGEQASLDDLA